MREERKIEKEQRNYEDYLQMEQNKFYSYSS